jgi:hypothetical protein
MNDVRRLVARAEKDPRPPDGDGERFSGYGVFSAPFDSGHLLAMRRFSASSLGPGYTSVWHRSPEGLWTIWSDQPPLLACPRYFGSALETAAQTEISVEWNGPASFTVAVPCANLTWMVRLHTTAASLMMNAMAALMPSEAWQSPRVLRSMGSMAGTFLRAGTVSLLGTVPNGQRFYSNPMRVWLIDHTLAWIAGRSLGDPGPLPTQARLGDFWLPQRGLFAIGRAFFEKTDPARHTLALSRFDVAADAPASGTWPSGPAYGSDRERLAG